MHGFSEAKSRQMQKTHKPASRCRLPVCIFSHRPLNPAGVQRSIEQSKRFSPIRLRLQVPPSAAAALRLLPPNDRMLPPNHSLLPPNDRMLPPNNSLLPPNENQGRESRSLWRRTQALCPTSSPPHALFACATKPKISVSILKSLFLSKIQ